jgi:hypothetical protein
MMGPTSLSIHFGRGQPPSTDLRDYLADGDRWILGEWVVDTPGLGAGSPFKPEWVAHMQTNKFARETCYGFYLEASDRMLEAWERYNNPEAPAGGSDRGGVSLRLQTQLVGRAGDVQDRNALQAAHKITFGVSRQLGPVNRSLFATSVSPALNLIFDFSKLKNSSSFSLFGAAGEPPLFISRGEMLVSITNGNQSVVLPCGNFSVDEVSYRPPPPTLPEWRLQDEDGLILYPELADATRFTASLERPDGSVIQKHVSHQSLIPGELTVQLSSIGPYGIDVIDRAPQAGTYRFYLDFSPSFSGPYSLRRGSDWNKTILYPAGELHVTSADIGNGRPSTGTHLVAFDVWDPNDMAVTLLDRHYVSRTQQAGPALWWFSIQWPAGGRVRLRNPWPFSVTLDRVVLTVNYLFPGQSSYLLGAAEPKQAIAPGTSVDIPLSQGYFVIYGHGPLPPDSQLVSNMVISYSLNGGMGSGFAEVTI